MPRFAGWIVPLLLVASVATAAQSPGRWPSVDETVIEKFASERGREARTPYLDTDQGDLLLFLFALAGAGGGFVMGYCWHKLFVAGRSQRNSQE